MQKTSSNSLEKYVQAKNRRNDTNLSGTAGSACLGAPVGTGGGVNAVEAIPTVNVFPLASAAECLDSWQEVKLASSGKGGSHRAGRNDGPDTIIGQLEAVPGESSLNAAAVTSESIEPKKKGIMYNPNDFTPYARRLKHR